MRHTYSNLSRATYQIVLDLPSEEARISGGETPVIQEQSNREPMHHSALGELQYLLLLSQRLERQDSSFCYRMPALLA